MGALTGSEWRGGRLCRGTVGTGSVHREARPSSDLKGCLQHLHEEGVNGGVSNQLEEEEVLQALQPDGAQCRQTQKEFGKSGREQSQKHVRGTGCLLTSVSKTAAGAQKRRA